MSNRTERFYNAFACFYPLADIFLKPQKQRLFHEIDLLPSGKLLEIGIGDGRQLSRYKRHAVTGIDTSAGMLRRAEKQNVHHAHLLRMNGEALHFDKGFFDYVVLSHVIAVVDNPDEVLEEVFRVLKNNGKVFILNHFTPHNRIAFIDEAFQPIAKAFHFKSFFRIENVPAIKNFRLLQKISFGPYDYFNLLIYGKA